MSWPPEEKSSSGLTPSIGTLHHCAHPHQMSPWTPRFSAPRCTHRSLFMRRSGAGVSSLPESEAQALCESTGCVARGRLLKPPQQLVGTAIIRSLIQPACIKDQLFAGHSAGCIHRPDLTSPSGSLKGLSQKGGTHVEAQALARRGRGFSLILLCTFRPVS